MEAFKENSAVLMCRPDYYGVFYKINTHMRRKGQKPVDPAGAKFQWYGLRHALEQEGIRSYFTDQAEGLPDMVFIANAGLVYKDDFVLSHFRFRKERGKEEAYFKTAFESFGFKIHELCEGTFEGHGDALFIFDEKETLFCGYSDTDERNYFRTSERGAINAAECIKKSPILVKLIHPDFYHLDTCLCPIGKYILCYPEAFDAHSFRVIENHSEVIPVSYRDAMQFVCNGIPIMKLDPRTRELTHWKLITTEPSPALRKELAKRDIELGVVYLSEFHKAGGSARCLVISLNSTFLYSVKSDI
ncbi:MAG: hypothetical protein HYT98_00885 [Candidatus Sungbacteria bacterium]|nr:hypothetical protein [Candidatus Sungbacteria bacterium]